MRERRKRMTARKTASRSLRAEIEELEKRLGCDYMDEEIMVEEPMSWMDDDMEVAPEAMSYMDEDIDVVDDSLLEDADAEMVDEIIEDDDYMRASEVDPNGVEEEITQDYLDAVEEVAHGTELATAPSISKVAPTKSKYAARLVSASKRLDRVAEYLEGNGRKDLALRIDKIADVVDQRINTMRRA